MIVTWSGKLFTLRVSRCDFDGDNTGLNQPELALIPLVVVVADDPVVDVLDPGTSLGLAVRRVETEFQHRNPF